MVVRMPLEAEDGEEDDVPRPGHEGGPSDAPLARIGRRRAPAAIPAAGRGDGQDERETSASTSMASAAAASREAEVRPGAAEVVRAGPRSWRSAAPGGRARRASASESGCRGVRPTIGALRRNEQVRHVHEDRCRATSAAAGGRRPRGRGRAAPTPRRRATAMRERRHHRVRGEAPGRGPAPAPPPAPGRSSRYEHRSAAAANTAGIAGEVPGQPRPEELVGGRRDPGHEDGEERRALVRSSRVTAKARASWARVTVSPMATMATRGIVAQDRLHDAVEPEGGGAVAQAQVAVERVRGQPVAGAELLARPRTGTAARRARTGRGRRGRSGRRAGRGPRRREGCGRRASWSVEGYRKCRASGYRSTSTSCPS